MIKEKNEVIENIISKINESNSFLVLKYLTIMKMKMIKYLKMEFYTVITHKDITFKKRENSVGIMF